MIDPVFLITRRDYGIEQIVYDDDTGGGIFGTNAELTYIAPDSGIYWLIVEDIVGDNIGGYIVDVRAPYAGAPTPVAPMPTPVPYMSELGPMNVYSSFDGVFSIEHPATWSDSPSALAEWRNFCNEDVICYAGEGDLLVIADEDLSALGGNMSQEEYEKLILDAIEGVPDIQILDADDFTTEQGLTGSVITVDIQGLMIIRRFMLVHNNRGLSATYVTTEENYEYLEALSEYSYGTVTVQER